MCARTPGLARFGRRRGWLLDHPAAARRSPAWRLPRATRRRRRGLLVAIAVSIAFLSASQDIVIDAWRIETFPEREQGVALAAYVWGYRIAMLLSGAGAIGFADVVGWHGSLTAMARAGGCVHAGHAARARAGAADRRSRAQPDSPPGCGRRWSSRSAISGGAPARCTSWRSSCCSSWAKRSRIPWQCRSTGRWGSTGRRSRWRPGCRAWSPACSARPSAGWLVVRIGTGRALIMTGFVQMASMGLYFALAVSGGDTRILLAKIIVENFAESMASRGVPDLPVVALLARVHRHAIRAALVAGGGRVAHDRRLLRRAGGSIGLDRVLCADHLCRGAGDAADARPAPPLSRARRRAERSGAPAA